MIKIKFICLFILAGTVASAEIFLNATEQQEQQTVAICVDVGKSCDGILLGRHWAVTEANCIAPWPNSRLLITQMTDNINCDHYETLANEGTTRRAYKVDMRPSWYRHNSDRAIITLDKPYDNQDKIIEAAKIDALENFQPWVTEAMTVYEESVNNPEPMARALANPVKILFLAIVLPTIIFIIFFIYFIFYTGNSKECFSRDTSNQYNYEKLDISS